MSGPWQGTRNRADVERPARPKAVRYHPTIGAPIGVPPSPMATRSAVTRPRMAGSVEICMRLFVVLVKADTPIMTSAPAKNQ
jgi:hypothetical protein